MHNIIQGKPAKKPALCICNLQQFAAIETIPSAAAGGGGGASTAAHLLYSTAAVHRTAFDASDQNMVSLLYGTLRLLLVVLLLTIVSDTAVPVRDTAAGVTVKKALFLRCM